MKITKLHFEDHPFFGTTEIDFTDSAGKPLQTIVLAGINGSGKTRLLSEMIRLLKENVSYQFEDYPFYESRERIKNILDVFFTKHEDKEIFQPLQESLETLDLDKLIRQSIRKPAIAKLFAEKGLVAKAPKCILLPSETHFPGMKPKTEPYVYQYAFIQEIDKKMIQAVPTYFATLIDKAIFQHRDRPAQESIRTACDEINGLFAELRLESRIIGLKEDGSRMPQFRNARGAVFDIDGLSSGEKQLFFRMMALKMCEANNSVILIDEPEISLHPAWQQYILKLYEKIGENNQVIVATHSPHVIASTAKENVKILTYAQETKHFEILDYHSIRVTKGAPAERILKDVMGLATTRDPEVQEKINLLWEMISQGTFETDRFRDNYQALERLLGTIDEDLVLMKMEIGKQQWEREHQYAQGQ